MVKVAKQPKGAGKPSKAKIAADKRRRQEEHLRKAQQVAYDKSYKMTMLQAAKAAGKAQALKDAAKKGSKRK